MCVAAFGAGPTGTTRVGSEFQSIALNFAGNPMLNSRASLLRGVGAGQLLTQE